ncbi:TlpA disulfide reductase family protein [Hymenobacter convexus]|uniref:TlpA disulfide reductase family protein n=1 Tax=Hymenobacter sp. CA1UV-4 TaxID=3063782 RepID=UPI0027136D79|nr:TlpA disulfide reductase family protein [Hymenobacter sp. CA1UV-4]MDO7851081.1 TlpA disulfide reductase family protein [Hymenobacter sp. CA1UV-4]
MMKLLLAALLLAPGLAPAQTPSSPFVVKGRVGQLNAPARVYLLRGSEILDSATLKNGAFELKGHTEMPERGQLVLVRNGRQPNPQRLPGNSLKLFLEPGPVVVTGSDSLPLAKFTGGPLTRDYLRLDAALQPAFARIKANGVEYQRATEAQRKEPAFAERIHQEYKATEKAMYQQQAAFVKANPASWVSLDALQTMQFMQEPQYVNEGPLYEALSPELKASRPGRFYGEMIQGLKNVQIGAVAPAFIQPTPEGKKVALADYRGRYVLVDFWASWCKPCRAENPAMLKTYNAFKGRNFEVLSVSIDDNRDKWVKAIADDHLPWTQVADLHGPGGEVPKLYGIRSVPQNFLLDPQGKILAVNLHGAELEAALARFVK